MKTCMNILISIWPTAVAEATRHSRTSRGNMFNLGLSRSYGGQEPKAGLDRLKVSRSTNQTTDFYTLLTGMEAGFFVYPCRSETEVELDNERQSTVSGKKMTS